MRSSDTERSPSARLVRISPGKKKNVLQDNADMTSQRLQIPVADIDAANFDRSFLYVVKTIE